MVFLPKFSNSIKDDLQKYIKTKEKQTDVKRKVSKYEPEPFNEYEEQFYEANVSNYRIDGRFDKKHTEKGALPHKYKMNINYPHLKTDVKEWTVKC